MSKASRKYKVCCKKYNRDQTDVPVILTRKSQSLHGYRAVKRYYQKYCKQLKKSVTSQYQDCMSINIPKLKQGCKK